MLLYPVCFSLCIVIKPIPSGSYLYRNLSFTYGLFRDNTFNFQAFWVGGFFWFVCIIDYSLNIHTLVSKPKSFPFIIPRLGGTQPSPWQLLKASSRGRCQLHQIMEKLRLKVLPCASSIDVWVAVGLCEDSACSQHFAVTAVPPHHPDTGDIKTCDHQCW